MERNDVVFVPLTMVDAPTLTFPAIPSAYYSRDGVPVLNTVGTKKERRISALVWYRMLEDDAFPLKTSYANTRRDQLGLALPPPSDASLSMTKRVRQIPDGIDWVQDERFAHIISQTTLPYSVLTDDIYRFPLNPNVNAYTVARLLVDAINDNDTSPLNTYLHRVGAGHLVGTLYYYPAYHLFFLMTRLASRPLTEAQIRLSKLRAKTSPLSPSRQFIDAVYNLDIVDEDSLLEIAQRIHDDGPLAINIGTTHSDWVRWAGEYLMRLDTTPINIVNWSGGVGDVSEKLTTWSDDLIDEKLKEWNLEPPFRSQFKSRQAFLQALAGVIYMHRSSAQIESLWQDD